jgi:hypothetical protein
VVNFGPGEPQDPPRDHPTRQPAMGGGVNHRAFRHPNYCPCSSWCVDDALLVFWSREGSRRAKFSQILTSVQQPLALCTKRFAQSFYTSKPLSLWQPVCGRCLVGVLELWGLPRGQILTSVQQPLARCTKRFARGFYTSSPLSLQPAVCLTECFRASALVLEVFSKRRGLG